MSNQRPKQRTVVVHVVRLCCLLISMLFAAGTALAQNTSFTYQGRLTDGGTPANGNYDLQFQLFDSSGGTTQIGPTQTINVVPVSAGIFTVTLDFGANAFPGANRFLDISARVTGAGAFTPLTPRQPITATPYAVRSLNTGSADALSSACNGCVTDTNIAGMAASKLTGTIPLGAVPSGSGNYIQNTSSLQASSNFNVSGDGKAGGTLAGNIVNSTTQYNIAGNRVLSVAGSGNLFAGVEAGIDPLNTGTNNAFFGRRAGRINSTGSFNAFFGWSAGDLNQVGSKNAFFGWNTGANITNGNNNTAIGADIAFGPGLINATAIGSNAQVQQNNAMVLGSINGINSATADTNVGIGTTMPAQALTIQRSGVAYIDVKANGGTQELFVGADSNGGIVSTVSNHDLILRAGNNTDKVRIRANGNVGIGTATPNARLQVSGGNIYVTNPNSLIITSPNGACWGILVNNAGVLSTLSVTCP